VANLTAKDVAEIETLLQPYIDDPPDPPDWDHPNLTEDGYKHRFWDMVRELKGVEYMSCLEGYLAVPILRQVLNARGCALTALGYDSEDEALDDLECLWDKVKLSMGEAPLHAAVRMAERHPVRFPTKHLGVKYHSFLNIAYHLQLMRGDDYIVLPTEKLGEILGVDPSRITDYRAYAKVEGYLKEVAKARFCTGGKGRATQFLFRWDGSR
jgi:hypothetical protein